MPRHQNSTLKDVAARAGVSIATVSRVLNQSSYVNPGIQENVIRAVSELGYFQNSVARSLKTNSTLTIGFVTANISNPYMITVAKSIEDLIREENYSLMMCSTEDDAERELLHLRLLMGRNIDGLILNGTGHNESFVSEMSKRIPVILIHRRYRLPEGAGDLVDSDNESGAYGLTKHLLSFGHKKIFVIKGSKAASTSEDRYNGFLHAMREAGLPAGENYPFRFEGDFTMQSGFRAVEYMNKMPEKPTAVLGLNNTITMGALLGLRVFHYMVPEDISVASYNNIESKELMFVRPTVHDVDPRRIGFEAGKALLERLAGSVIPNREIIVGGKIIPGNAVSIPQILH